MAEFVIFGVGAVALSVLGLRATRLVALRVDDNGLTLGGSPLRYESTVVPSGQLRAIRITRQTQAPYLPVITADRKGKADDIDRQVKGWRIDVTKLGEAMQSVAPGVRLADQR